MASSPWPGTASNDSARGSLERRAAGAALTIALRERVLAVALGGRDEAEHVVLVDAIGGGDGDDFGLAARERAGLVEHDGVQRGRLLERHRVLEEDAALGPSPVPTMMAVGVASPSASGQVITTTVIANSSESWTSRPTTKYQTTNVSPPPTSATRTSQNAALSASRWPGALEFCASWTSLTICASAVSEPTAVARARRVPFLLIVAPMS